MSKTEDEGMRKILQDAEGLANVLRIASGGRLDLRVMLRSDDVLSHTMTWPQAYTEARAIAGMLGQQAKSARPVDYDAEVSAAMVATEREHFCSVCGPLDEPGVHNQRDCPRFAEAAHEQSRRVAASDHAEADQAYVDGASGWAGHGFDGARAARPGQGG